MALVKKSRVEVFEKRKSIVMAIFKQDAAERSRRIVAMKDKSCNLSGVREPVEQVARSRSAAAAHEPWLRAACVKAAHWHAFRRWVLLTACEELRRPVRQVREVRVGCGACEGACNGHERVRARLSCAEVACERVLA